MRRSVGKHGVTTVAVACLVLCSSLAVGATFGPTAADGVERLTTSATVETADENLSVGDLSAPTRVRLGEAYTVTATIRNEGDFTVREVAYRIVGNVVAAQFVQLPANSTKTVRFEISGNAITGFPQGTYVHGVFTGDAHTTGNLTLGSSTETTTEERTTTVEAATTTEATTTTEERTTTETQATTVDTRTTTETEGTAADTSSSAGTLRMDVRLDNGTLSVTVTGGPSDTEARAVVVRDGELDWEGLRTLVELLLDANAQQNVTVESVEIDRP